MKNIALLISAAALCAGCDHQAATVPAPHAPVAAAVPAPSAPPAAAAPPVLAAESIGAVRFGERLTQVEAALKEKAQGKPGADCSYVGFASMPRVHFMVEGGVVVRADVREDYPNVTGIGIGGDPAALKANYPAAVVSANKYDEKGHDTRIAGTGKTALIFEDDGSRITRMRAGVEPAVSYSEGCS